MARKLVNNEAASLASPGSDVVLGEERIGDDVDNEMQSSSSPIQTSQTIIEKDNGLNAASPSTGSHHCCTHDSFHSDNYTLVDEIYAMPVIQLWNALFTQTSGFLLEFLETRKCSDILLPTWSEPITTGQTAILTYKIPLGMYTPVTRVQSKVLERAKEGSGICTESKTATPDVPYGSAFETVVYICLMPGSDHPLENSRLLISYQIAFTSDVGWFVKAAVRNPLKAKIVEYHTDLALALRKHVEKGSGDDKAGGNVLNKKHDFMSLSQSTMINPAEYPEKTLLPQDLLLASVERYGNMLVSLLAINAALLAAILYKLL